MDTLPRDIHNIVVMYHYQIDLARKIARITRQIKAKVQHSLYGYASAKGEDISEIVLEDATYHMHTRYKKTETFSFYENNYFFQITGAECLNVFSNKREGIEVQMLVEIPVDMWLSWESEKNIWNELYKQGRINVDLDIPRRVLHVHMCG